MIKQLINKVSDRILEESKYSKDRSDKYGEVFTPPGLIKEMLDKIPPEMWLNKNKTFLLIFIDLILLTIKMVLFTYSMTMNY